MSPLVLVDTSVWVKHFRAGDAQLARLLEESEVIGHPFIVGELACGQIKNRLKILGLLQSLASLQVVSASEYLFFIERYQLMGRGLGFVDIHLLASAKLEGVRLWSYDTHLMKSADRLEVSFP